MTDRAKFEQMLEYLINEDKEKAEELFHELVVAKSRDIYESLLDDDIQVEETEEDEEVEESFEMDEVGGDATDDFLGDIEAGDEDGEEVGDEFGGADDFEGDDVGGAEPATKDDVMDIKDALEDLKAEFEAMLSGEEEGEEEFGGEEEGEEEFGGEEEGEEEETEEGFVREYVEKVAAGHGTEKKGAGETAGTNTKSTVAGKNDMGGTTANIAKGGEGSTKGTAGGLANPATKDLNSGNVNVPGSKTATKLGGVAKGHGAEKKGAGETGVDGKSIIGSRK